MMINHLLLAKGPINHFGVCCKDDKPLEKVVKPMYFLMKRDDKPLSACLEAYKPLKCLLNKLINYLDSGLQTLAVLALKIQLINHP